jgi:DNA-binding SARP family transcriptional activator/TolB-like protein/Flp pilus assembly protein TadD
VFKLRLFGTPQLEGPAGVISAPGPRRLALLASLAAAGPSGLTRDKLVARLWSEADDDRAKRNLSQLLYAMRIELGADLVEGTGTVRLDAARCWSDVAAFDAALEARDDAAALEQYRGAFLDGFHLADAPEFAEWADHERDRRSRAARAAAVRVAESAKSSLAWHRAYALDPLDGTLVARLMDALDAEGNRAGAIRIGEQHSARVRSELESEPEGAVVKRLDALRRAPAVSPSRTDVAPAAVTGATAAAAGELFSAPASAARIAAVAPDRGPRGVPRRVLLIATAALALLVVVAWSMRPAAPLRDGEFVLLAEFSNQTSDTLLTRSIGTAVAAALHQSAHVVSLPRASVSAALLRMERPDTSERLDTETAREVAQREGVRFVLAGEVVESGTDREVIARIIEASTGRVVTSRTFRASSTDELFDAIDRMAAAMRRDLGEARSSVGEAVPLPQVTTRSLPALHHYAEGIAAARRLEHDLAASLYQRAVMLDSNFASAHALLAAHYNQNNDVPRATNHFARALAQLDRLPVDEGLRIRVADAYARGDLAQAVRFSRHLLALRPRDFVAWSRLGFYLFASGDNSAARAAYAVADSLGPLSATSIMNIGTAWANSARETTDPALYDSARVQYRRGIALRPAMEYSDFYNLLYGTTLLGAGRADSARATFERMSARGTMDRSRGLRSLGFLDAIEGRWSSAAASFGESAEIAIGQRQWTSAIRGDALRAELLLALGDRQGAQAPLRRATTIALREPIEARAVAFVALAQVKAGDAVAAGRLLERMRAFARDEHVGEQAAILTVEGAMQLAAGRPAQALTALEGAHQRDASSIQGRMLLAHARAATGADSSAAELWERLAQGFWFGFEGQFDWQFAWYELGVVQERLQRIETAVESYRRSVARYPVSPLEAGRQPLALRTARERLRQLEGGASDR